MMKFTSLRTPEGKKLLAVKAALAVFFVLHLVLPLFFIIPSPSPRLKNVNLTSKYDRTNNKTKVEIEAEFDRNVKYGTITIDYFAENESLLLRKTSVIYGNNTKTASTVITEYVEGNAAFYEVVSFEMETSRKHYPEARYAYYFLPITVFVFLWAMTLRYSKFAYKDMKIAVYSGWFDRKLIVNDEIVDRYIELIHIMPINLSAKLEDDLVVEATICTSGWIKVKVNGKLVNKSEENKTRSE